MIRWLRGLPVWVKVLVGFVAIILLSSLLVRACVAVIPTPPAAPAPASEPTAPAVAEVPAPVEKREPRPRRSRHVVTAEEYAQIQSGMSYAEVVAIIGEPGEELSSSDLAGYRTVMYMWQNRNGTNMNAMFQNDALIQKAQMGLPSDG